MSFSCQYNAPIVKPTPSLSTMLCLRRYNSTSVFIAIAWLISNKQLTTKSYKPVGLYGPIVPQVPNAPSLECPQASIAARRRAASSIRISRRASCCCSSAIAGISIGANFKIYLLHQFCSNRVHFFYNAQDTQTQKNDWSRILKFEFCDF